MKKSKFIRKIEKELKEQKALDENELKTELPTAIYDCVKYLKKEEKEISIREYRAKSKLSSDCHICDGDQLSARSSHEIAIEDLFIKEFKKSTFDKSNVVGELLESIRLENFERNKVRNE